MKQWTRKEWEIVWLYGFSEWWPDSISLPGSTMVVRRGDPSSPMPPAAQAMVSQARVAGMEYVCHIERECHAYRIGPATDYLSKEQIAAEIEKTMGRAS